MHADRAIARDPASPVELAELPESQAQGEVARLYADIRATLNVNLVNLVYRHLATVPHALPWAWRCLRPHFASGTLHAQAERLRAQVALRVQPWHASVSDLPGHADAGRLVATYTQANSLNLMAMTQLLVIERHSSTPGLQAGAATPRPPPACAAPPVTAPLPPLPAWNALGPDVAARVLRLNRLGESGEPQIIASLYRHLAAWPDLLARVEPALQRLEDAQELAPALAFTAQAAARIAQAQPLALDAPPPAGLDPATRQRLVAFATVTIPKMVPIGLALHTAFARAEPGSLTS